MSAIRLRKGRKTRHCSKKDAPAELHGTWRKVSFNSKNTNRATFYEPISARATPVPTSESPEEREFVAEPGASMHMLSKKDVSSKEMEALRRSRNPTKVLTANGEVQTNEEAHVYVHDLDLFVTV